MHFVRSLVLGAALLGAGCGTVPLSSLAQLSRIDAQTTDLSVLRVALRLPSAIRTRPQGVNLEVVVKVSGEPDRKTTYFLTETQSASDLSGLPPSGNGFSTYAFQLSPADLERFNVVRAAAFDKQRLGKTISIGMGVATKEFCRVGPPPDGRIIATTYLKTSETGGYVVVTKDVDLANDRSLAEQIATLGPC